MDGIHASRYSEPVTDVAPPPPPPPSPRIPPSPSSDALNALCPSRHPDSVRTPVPQASHALSAARIARHIDGARMLPVAPRAVYDALLERPSSAVHLATPHSHRKVLMSASAKDPSSAVSLPRDLAIPEPPVRRARTATDFLGANHRSKSLPRRPSALSPLPRAHTLGFHHVPTTAANGAPENVSNVSPSTSSTGRTRATLTRALSRRQHNHSLVVHQRNSFRHVLLNAKVHACAITLADGTRLYAYCRPLSTLHAIVVLSTCMHTPIYLSGIESTATHYASIVDDTLGFAKGCNTPLLNHTPVSTIAKTLRAIHSTSSINSNIFKCPPLIAKELCSFLLKSIGATDLTGPLLRQTPPMSSVDSATGSLKNAPMPIVKPFTTYSIDSALSTSASKTKDGLNSVSSECYDRKWSNIDTRCSSTNEDSDCAAAATSSGSLPWMIAAESAESDTAGVVRTVELADATLLFRHFPVRGIVSVLVALLEERRVCIVGPDSSIVSRVVLAFANLLRPFEWPHPMSPILVEHMVPVLGAPFPFLVGLLEDHFPQTKALDLDDVVFADMTSGKITTTAEVGDLYRRVPRRLRYKIERRLTRTRTACLRQVYKSKSSQSIASMTNSTAATTYVYEDGSSNFGTGRTGRSLWKSKSHQKFCTDAPALQNIWMEHSTVVALDKAIRKFFAELLEDLPSVRSPDESLDARTVPTSDDAGAKGELTSKSSLGASKRELQKTQLVKTFSETQMFMQWEQDEQRDLTFGLSQSDLRKHRAVNREMLISRKDKENIGIDEETTGVDVETDTPKLADKSGRHPVTRVTDDAFSGDEGVFSAGEEESARARSRRVKFRSVRKGKGKNKLQFNDEVKEIAIESREVLSDGEGPAWIDPNEFIKGRTSIEYENGFSEPERECETSGFARRAWRNLKLPSSTWAAPSKKGTREFGLFSSGKEPLVSKEVEEVDDPIDDEGLDVVRTVSEVDGFAMMPVNDKDANSDIVDDNPVLVDMSGRERVMAWGRRRFKVISGVVGA